MKAKGIIIPLLLLLALFGAVQRAGATTKTVTYSLSRGMDASYEYVYLTHSGNAPFDGTTEVTRQLMSNRTYASFDLPDGFRLSFNWKGAKMTSTAYSSGTNFFCADENVEFYLSWNLTSRYVTSVSVTDISGNPSALNGGGTASTDFNFREQGNITYTLATNTPFAKITITYTDAPDLSIFQALGNGIYGIQSPLDLRHLADYVNNGRNTAEGLTFRQIANITFNHTTAWNNSGSTENNYTAIGTDESPFRGTFEGQSLTISGIRIFKDSGNYHGLFGYLGAGATVSGITLADARITGYYHVGGIAGKNYYANVEYCTVGSNVCIHSTVNQALSHGGVVGDNQGTVQRCISRATLTAAITSGCDNFGGIVGLNSSNTVQDCIAIGATVPNVSKNGAIIGQDYRNTSDHKVYRNYYRACSVAGTANATGVGVGFDNSITTPHDVADNQGALALYSITLPDDVTLDRTASATLPGSGNATYTSGAMIDGTPYALATAALTLSYTGAMPEGYELVGTVRKSSDNSDVTASVLSGTTLTMPAYDITVTAVVTPIIYSGYCGRSDVNNGHNVVWTYNVATKALTISRNNTDPVGDNFEMADYDSNHLEDVPWHDYKDDLTGVIMADGITHIGSYAFYNCSNLATINGATNLTRVGAFAFQNTKWLSDQPGGVVYVGHVAYSFKGNSGGQTVTIADGTVAIAEQAFYNQTLAGIIIPSSVSYMGSQAFADCNSLHEVYLLPSNPPTLGSTSGLFHNNGGGQTFYLRNSEYETGEWATVWSNMGNLLNSSGRLTIISTITAASGVTATATPTVSYGGTDYYAAGTTVTLSYTGVVPTGKTLVYYVNDTIVDGDSFTMPATDVTVSVVFMLSPVLVSYIDADRNGQTTVAEPLTGEETVLGSAGQTKWYVANGNVSYTHQVTINGDVRLILADGKTMTMTHSGSQYCINGNGSGKNLSIYGQSEGSGALTVTSSGYGIRAETLVINGGHVTATTTNHAIIVDDDLIINGGVVKVTSTGENSEGFFSNYVGDRECLITIDGGQVETSSFDFVRLISGEGYPDRRILLNYRDPDDYIKFGSIDPLLLKIAPGKVMTDGSTYFAGSPNFGGGLLSITLRPVLAIPVEYVDADGKAQTVQAIPFPETRPQFNFNIFGANRSYWFVVDKDISYVGQLDFPCEIHLILADGKTMTITETRNQTACLRIADLTIYGQSGGTGTLALDCGQRNKAIDGSSIVVNGGRITTSSTAIITFEGLYSSISFTMNGGQVETNCLIVSEHDNNGGDYAINLGFRNPCDYIKIKSRISAGNVKIAEGQILTDGTTTYSGSISDPSVLVGKTLRLYYDPATAQASTLAQVTKEGVTAWWSTFYDGTTHYLLNEGAMAYTMGSDYKLYRLGDDGRTIPKGVAVVIISSTSEVSRIPAGSASFSVADHSGENILQGSDTPVSVSGLGGTPYVLGVVDNQLGFYPFTGDTIPAGKAFYILQNNNI